MADVINLRLARKAKARGKALDKAAANRAKHGLSKADRERHRLEQERTSRLIDGARRDKP